MVSFSADENVVKTTNDDTSTITDTEVQKQKKRKYYNSISYQIIY